MSVLFLFIARRVDYSNFLDNIYRFRWEYIVYYAVFFAATYFVFSLKIITIFKNEAKLKVGQVFPLLLSTTFMSFIAPGGGEIFKIAYLQKKFKVPVVRSAVLFLFERFYTLLLMMSAACIIVAIYKIDSGYNRYIYNSLAVIAALLLVMVAAILMKERTIKLIYFIFESNRVLSFARTYLKSLGIKKIENLFVVSGILFNARVMITLTFLNIVMYSFYGYRHYLLYNAVEYSIDPVLCMASYMIVGLTFSLPLLPGRVGSFEVLYLALFNLVMKVPLDVAVLVLIADRIILSGLLFLFGLVSFNFLHLEWKDIHSIRKSLQDETSESSS